MDKINRGRLIHIVVQALFRRGFRPKYSKHDGYVAFQNLLKSYRSELAASQEKLERYEKREQGMEWCESCEKWFPIEEMHLTEDGVWLCEEAWKELYDETQLEAEGDER